MSEITTEKNLTPQQRKAIEALLTTGNVAAAALEAGVNRSSLYRWMNDETFASELRRLEAEAVAALSRTLAGLGDAVAQTLRDALAPDQKITIRLRASEMVIGNLLRLRELVDLEDRIKALEKMQNEADAAAI